ncbi:hypothetical protein [Variovorax guangxiensis]|nr:hypothetical protein [Variovorax guangxiensis]
MQTLKTLLEDLDELETRIEKMDRMTCMLMVQIEPPKRLPLIDDQVALELAHITLASLRKQRRMLLASIEELRG